MRTLVLTILGVCLMSCNRQVLCYTQADCANRYSLMLQVEVKDDNLILTLKNHSYRRISLEDSIEIFFFKQNQNLRSPYSDSVLALENAIISFVEFAQPIVIDGANKIVRGDNKTIQFVIPLTVLVQKVKREGAKDSEYQLYNGFQLYIRVVSKRGSSLTVGSNIFRLER